jgi:alkylation response protein AidB-like acyl-CoA dehydrogenase
MSTPHHYKANLRDTFFNLFEVLDIEKQSLGKGPFTEMDADSVREMLLALHKVCVNDLAASFSEADRVPLTLDPEGNVHLPEGLKRSLKAYFDAGMHLLELPPSLGGMGAPPTVSWAAFEMVSGSNPVAGYYLFGSFIARTIDRLGTPAQRARFAQRIIDRRWGGSMVLTEPDAGSDVGAGRTKAKHIKDDLYEIQGVKRFITNGDFDAAENIVHLVLARPEGAGPGTKGLSMFIVPKFWVNEDGSLGERNGAYCTNVEKKMGIKGSATCEMTFGDQKPARGLLVGNVHDGIRQMFHVIEQARMAVGVKSLATLSTAYLNALEYAKERVQGADLLQSRDKSAPRVRIFAHPDVRRMLMSQKAHAEGMRALALFTASIQDEVELKGGHGIEATEELDRLNDLLLPLVKGYCSEKVFEQLSLSLQCYGGSGFLQDYPIEQYIRDQKIDSLYEGTTHIQALDLLLRKVARDGGESLRSLFARIQKTIDSAEGGASLADERAALARALENVQAIYGKLMEKVGESLYHAGLQGNRILAATAELTIGWLLVRHAAVALARRETNPADRAFYDGKIASARWFVRNVFPAFEVTRKLVEESSLELMELSEANF